MSAKWATGIIPYRRAQGRLLAGEPVICRDEEAAGRRGHRMLDRYDGLVFYTITTSAAGDAWREVLTTVGDVPDAIG